MTRRFPSMLNSILALIFIRCAWSGSTQVDQGEVPEVEEISF